VTFPFGQSVSLVKRTKGVPDALGNDTWTTTSTTVRGAFDPGTSVESVQGQDLLVTSPRVFLPAGTDVGAIDAIDVAGSRYEVDGSPNDYTNPFSGWRPGVVVQLKRVTG
jgi:hypothetical protein